MTDEPLFKGVYTALITPFKEDQSVDEEAYVALINDNIEQGVSGIVPCGTTGESPTLTPEEQLHLIELAVKTAQGKVPVIAGTGSNSTAKTIEMSQKAEKLGVSALLVVNPYYNKPTQEGLYLHFKAVAESVSIPIIVYNIKGRTGVNVETETLLRLINDCKNIRAVKEASGDLEQITEVISQVPKNFSVLSGDDGITLEVIQKGGHGVISVASNFIPRKMSMLVHEALTGNMSEATKIQTELEALFTIEFIETNPIPIKYMIAKKGKCKEVYRLPLCALHPDNKKKVDAFLETFTSS
ncbi:MAG: 4-hydroxy-tetrahydrodipicolinate synthase [Candidatus Woesearchaeota archaeon]